MGGPRSGPGDPTAADPAAREPPGSELQEGVASRPRPGAARGEAGNRREPPPLPGKGQRTGAGPQPDYRVPSPGSRRGVDWDKATPPAPGPLIPPRFRKIRPAWRESGPEGQGSLQLGGALEWWERGHQVPPVATLPRVPPGATQFSSLTPLYLQKKSQSWCRGDDLVNPGHPGTQECHRPQKEEASEVPARKGGKNSGASRAEVRGDWWRPLPVPKEGWGRGLRPRLAAPSPLQRPNSLIVD